MSLRIELLGLNVLLGFFGLGRLGQQCDDPIQALRTLQPDGRLRVTGLKLQCKFKRALRGCGLPAMQCGLPVLQCLSRNGRSLLFHSVQCSCSEIELAMRRRIVASREIRIALV